MVLYLNIEDIELKIAGSQKEKTLMMPLIYIDEEGENEQGFDGE